MQQVLRFATVFLVFLQAVPSLRGEENPVLKELLSRRAPVSKDAVAPLPAATLSDGLSAAQQRERITAIPDNRQSWENLTRRSAVAPFVLKISQPEDKSSAARSVDLWFVTYGKLDRLASDDFLQEQFQDARESGEAENRPRIRALTDDALRQRGLKIPAAASDPRFLSVEMNLLERVRISGTTQSVKTTTADSVTVASFLDPAFDKDREFPNSWRSIDRDAAGVRQYGAPRTYHSMGSYVKATRLAEPAGALLIEYHVAFTEPEDWFHGANLLRSKLPIVAQDAVRRFRRNFDK